MLLPAFWGAARTRRRLLPGWDGPPALVVDVVIWISMVVVTSEILGAVGLFRRTILAIGLAAVGLAAGLLAGRPEPEAPALRAPAPDRRQVAVAIAIGVAFAVPWAASTWASARSGTWSVDSLVYHLPFAAQWVQTGSLWHVNRLNPDTVVPYNPATSEILHALGMAAFHNALLTPFINLVWELLALTAAWSIGRPANRGPQCLALGLAIANCPLLLVSQPGTAMSDLPLLALALAAVAIMVQAPPSRRAAIPLGLALGLAAGTKLDGLAFVGVVGCVYPLLARREERLACAVRVIPAALLTGGYFYVRNLAAVGNPLPGLHTIFPAVTAPTDAALNTDILHYLGDTSVLRHYVLPAFHTIFGALWPLSLAVIVGGVVITLIQPPTGAYRLAAVGATATLAAWLVTPTGAGGTPGHPTLFVYNSRYAGVAFVVGAVLLGAFGQRLARLWEWVCLAVAAALCFASLASPASWPSAIGYTATIGWKEVGILVLAPIVLALGAAALWIHRRPTDVRLVRITSGAVAGAVLFAAGYLMVEHDIPRWYRGPGTPFSPALVWAGRLRHQRVGAVEVDLTFPLYGDRLTNRAAAVGAAGPGHEYAAPSTCPWLRADINAGHYSYVIIAPNYGYEPPSAENTWLDGASAATTVFSSADSRVYRIDGTLSDAGCNRVSS
jgi:uncharacterized membrane protein (UPF0136 family)